MWHFGHPPSDHLLQRFPHLAQSHTVLSVRISQQRKSAVNGLQCDRTEGMGQLEPFRQPQLNTALPQSADSPAWRWGSRQGQHANHNCTNQNRRQTGAASGKLPPAGQSCGIDMRALFLMVLLLVAGAWNAAAQSTQKVESSLAAIRALRSSNGVSGLISQLQ